jgi:murein tripeptide amidase MpaA
MVWGFKMCLTRILICILSGAISSTLGYQTKSYAGYQVIRVAQEHAEPLSNSLEAAVEVTQVSVDNVTYLDMLVEPRIYPLVAKLLNVTETPYNILIQDLQKSIQEENTPGVRSAEFRGTCTSLSGISWTNYHPFDTISSYLDCLSAQYGHVVQLYTIGMSSEGKPLKVLQISTSGRGSRKPAIFIDGGIHAREWISPATVTFIIHELVENRNNYQEVLDKYDFYILPSVNPDGYEYSRNYDRMWRKTRSTNEGSSCRGTDPNRNFDIEWGKTGTSTNPCSDVFAGNKPFSEPETAALRDFVMARNRNIKMYLTFHSYGQMILYPWGYARKDHNREQELKRVGDIGARAMNNRYNVGSAAKVLYPSSGGSDDWAFGKAEIGYSYTIELPDEGRYGFILPANKIRGVANEAMSAVVAMANNIRD